MGSSKVVVALYRSLLRNAKILDRHKCFKAILPPDFHWGNGNNKCDYFKNDTSCVATLRAEFRAERAPHQLRDAIDDALRLHKDVSELITTDEKYAREKAHMSTHDAEALDKARELNDAALAIRYDDNQDDDIAVAMWRESITIFPTADAHAHLAACFLETNELDRAEAECKRALELDPTLGLAYAYLAHIRAEQGDEEVAFDLYEKAKTAPRDDDRFFPSVALAKLHMSKGRLKPALHEFIHTLHWVDSNVTAAVRSTILQIATLLVEEANVRVVVVNEP